MKMIVAGSRSYEEMDRVFTYLDRAHEQTPFTEIVSGLARGPDMYGKWWAESRGIPVKEFPADWDNLGRKAGPLRNIQMGDYADALIAFLKKDSKGTKHMIQYMTSLNKPVKVILV